jgi:hypothetical protein
LPAGCSTAFAEVNTTVALARLRRFAQSMAPGIPPIDQALPAARELLASAGVPFKIVGGLAVIHHGYARTTEEIDLLVEAGSQESIDARLEPFGFARETPHRLRRRLPPPPDRNRLARAGRQALGDGPSISSGARTATAPNSRAGSTFLPGHSGADAVP